MSSSVFKEFPSPGGGVGAGSGSDDVIDGFYTDDNHMNLEAGGQTQPNMLVIINRNGNYSAVDQARLHDLLVNDPTATNTTACVIRVGSPTPSHQAEMDEQDELERELADMYRDADESNADRTSDTVGSDTRGGDESEGDDLDDEDDDGDDDGADDETDDDDVEPNADADDDDDYDDEDAEKRPRGVTGRQRQLKIARSRARKAAIAPVKVPRISVTVEKYFSAAETKQLQLDVLSIARITDPKQVVVDFEQQRNVIANDHCYTMFKMPDHGTTKPPDAAAASNIRAGRTERTCSDTIVLSDDGDTESDVSAKRRTATGVGGDAVAGPSTTDASESEGDEPDAEEYDPYGDSDKSYVSPSESDRDSDLDFNLNDRAATRTKKLNRSRTLKQQHKQKQRVEQQQQQVSKAVAKKRRSAETTASPEIAAEPTESKRKVTPIKMPKPIVPAVAAVASGSAVPIKNHVIVPTSKAPAIAPPPKAPAIVPPSKAPAIVPASKSPAIAAMSKAPTIAHPSRTPALAAVQSPPMVALPPIRSIHQKPATVTTTATTPTMPQRPITQLQTVRNVVSTTGIQRPNTQNRMILVRKDGTRVVTAMPSSGMTTPTTTSAAVPQFRRMTPNGVVSVVSQPFCSPSRNSLVSGTVTATTAASPLAAGQRTVHSPQTMKRIDSAAAAASAAVASASNAKKPRLEQSLFSTPDIIKKVDHTASKASASPAPASQVTLTTTPTSNSSLPASKRVHTISVFNLPPISLANLSNRNMIIKSASTTMKTMSLPPTMQRRIVNNVPVTMTTSIAGVTRIVPSPAAVPAVPTITSTVINGPSAVTTLPPRQQQHNNIQQQQPPTQRPVVLMAKPCPPKQMVSSVGPTALHIPPPTNHIVHKQHLHHVPPPTPPLSSNILNCGSSDGGGLGNLTVSFAASMSSSVTATVEPITVDTPLLSDADGQLDDALIAKLAEDKNLQLVIDQQVLAAAAMSSVQSPADATIAKPVVILQQDQQQQQQPQPRVNSIGRIQIPISTSAVDSTISPTITLTRISNPIVSTPPATAATTAAAAGIKIVRSNGRIITLPPIEAPTTRGAKRRAQSGTAGVDSPATPTANASPAQLAVQATANVSIATASGGMVTPKSRRASVMPNRRISMSGRKSAAATTANKNKSLTAMATPATPPILVNSVVPVAVAAATPSSPMVIAGSPTIALQTPRKPNDKPATTTSTFATVAAATTVVIDDDYDDDEGASDGSYNSEDDPYRLWCICRQPHNNRFMICCDKCSDWFHGKCVNVNKGMGTEMEKQGIEWVCPNCLQKHPHLQQRQLAVLNRRPAAGSRKSSNASASSVASSSTSMPLSNSVPSPIRTPPLAASSTPAPISATNTPSAAGVATLRKPPAKTAGAAATPSPAAKQTPTTAKPPSLTPQPTAATVPAKTNIATGQPSSTATDRVDVYDRKTGRVLSGNSAPTSAGLKRWLNEHPNYDVCGAAAAANVQVLAFQAKSQQLRQLAHDLKQEGKRTQLVSAQQPAKVQTTLRIGASQRVQLVGQPTATTNNATPVSITRLPGTPKLTSTPAASSVARSSASGTPKTPVTPPVDPLANPKASAKAGAVPIRVHLTDPVRLNVQRTLKEQLTGRMKELTATAEHPKLSADDIHAFVVATEREIFQLFGGDTGSKYRAKYRSIMFNLTDRKNATLFRKICERSCSAAGLVRMTAEQMASQELAQWRQNEVKHQLEIIEKTEMDSVACAQSAAKTARADEETVAIEDVVSATAKTVCSTPVEPVRLQTPAVTPLPQKDGRIDSRLERRISSVSAAQPAKSPLTTNRSRSRSRDGDLSDRSRTSSTRGNHQQQHGTSNNSGTNKRSRDSNSSSSEHHRPKDTERLRRMSATSAAKTTDTKRPKDLDTRRTTTPPVPSKATPPKPVIVADNFTIHDKILQAQSTFDRVLGPAVAVDSAASATSIGTSASATASATIETMPTPPDSLNQPDDVVNISDDETPVRTPSPPTRSKFVVNPDLPAALWSGSIFMIDVATFQISISPMMGETAGLPGELPDELEIVGRIRAEQVWDYVQKLKRSQNNDVRLVRFGSGSADDVEAYETLFDYLLTRKRYGVIKSKVMFIKDFYIFPLEAHAWLPTIMPQTGFEFEEGRPNLLLGLLVINRLAVGKRPLSCGMAAESATQAKSARLSEPSLLAKPTAIHSMVSAILDEVRYTPPTSPKKNSASLPAQPKVHSIGSATSSYAVAMSKKTFKVLDDGDEPYSPGGASTDDDDDDNQFLSVLSGQNNAHPPSSSVDPSIGSIRIPGLDSALVDVAGLPNDLDIGQLKQHDFNRLMHGVDREIEANRIEIGLLQGGGCDANSMDQPYSPSRDIDERSRPPQPNSALANIQIPANLHEILNSIKTVSTALTTPPPPPPPLPPLPQYGGHRHSAGAPPAVSIVNEEYNPLPVSAVHRPYGGAVPAYTPTPFSGKGTSKLAQLTDEQLMSMVPDDIRATIVQLPKGSGGSGMKFDEYVP